MQVALFRALKSANIDDEAAAKAVVVVEEQIDMAVGRAIEPLKQQIAGLELKLDQRIAELEGKSINVLPDWRSSWKAASKACRHRSTGSNGTSSGLAR